MPTPSEELVQPVKKIKYWWMFFKQEAVSSRDWLKAVEISSKLYTYPLKSEDIFFKSFYTTMIKSKQYQWFCCKKLVNITKFAEFSSISRQVYKSPDETSR